MTTDHWLVTYVILVLVYKHNTMFVYYGEDTGFKWGEGKIF